jgi:hypothetical protein
MSRTGFDPRDEALKAMVREALAARDRARPAPRFARLWPREAQPRRSALHRRPGFAAAFGVALLAGVAWMLLGRGPAGPGDGFDSATQLAAELSAPDYWRVPTDELLAFAAPPLNADLPLPDGFHVSLEESLL